MVHEGREEPISDHTILAPRLEGAAKAIIRTETEWDTVKKEIEKGGETKDTQSFDRVG